MLYSTHDPTIHGSGLNPSVSRKSYVERIIGIPLFTFKMYVWAALTFFFLSTPLGPWDLPIFSSGYIQHLQSSVAVGGDPLVHPGDPTLMDPTPIETASTAVNILRLAYVFYRPQSCNLVPYLLHCNPAAELTRPLGMVGIRAGATDVVWLFWDLRLHQDTYFMNSKTSTRQSWHANEIFQTRLWTSDVSYLRTAGIPAESTEANCTVDHFDNAGDRISREHIVCLVWAKRGGLVRYLRDWLAFI